MTAEIGELLKERAIIRVVDHLPAPKLIIGFPFAGL